MNGSRRAAPRRPGRWRHLPAALLGVALLLLIVALAGPQAREPVPRDRAVVLLVIDVSLSMNATDVTPTRLLAAQDAATRFVAQLPAGINLGLESFSGTAEVLVAPTTNHDQVAAAISHLQLGPSTATGDAIAAAPTAISQFAAPKSPVGSPANPVPPTPLRPRGWCRRATANRPSAATNSPKPASRRSAHPHQHDLLRHPRRGHPP